MSTCGFGQRNKKEYTNRGLHELQDPFVHLESDWISNLGTQKGPLGSFWFSVSEKQGNIKTLDSV